MSETVDVFCASSTEKDMETYGLVISRGHEKIYSASGVVYSTPGAGNYNAVVAALGWLLTNGYAGDTTTIYIGNYQCVMQMNLRKEIPPILFPQYIQIRILSGKFRNLSFKWTDKNQEALELSQKACELMKKTYGLCREGKAKALSVRLRGDRYIVKSQNRPGIYYTVNLKAKTCDCPDFIRRGKIKLCKHIIAAQNAAV